MLPDGDALQLQLEGERVLDVAPSCRAARRYRAPCRAARSAFVAIARRVARCAASRRSSNCVVREPRRAPVRALHRKRVLEVPFGVVPAAHARRARRARARRTPSQTTAWPTMTCGRAYGCEHRRRVMPRARHRPGTTQHLGEHERHDGQLASSREYREVVGGERSRTARAPRSSRARRQLNASAASP